LVVVVVADSGAGVVDGSAWRAAPIPYPKFLQVFHGDGLPLSLDKHLETCYRETNHAWGGGGGGNGARGEYIAFIDFL
jgi:hypothetical protein